MQRDDNSEQNAGLTISCFALLDWPLSCGEHETRDPKLETFLCVGVVDAVELGELETHHVFRRGAHHFFLAIGDWRLRAMVSAAMAVCSLSTLPWTMKKVRARLSRP